MVGSNVFTQRLFKLWIPLLLYSIFLLFPFTWMAIVSIKPDQLLLDTRINPFAIISPTLENYRYLLQETAFPRWIWNTLVVTAGATALSLFCSILIGYALGRFRFRGGNTLGIAIFLLYLVPPTLLFIPLSQIVSRFGLYNSYWALILVYPTFLIPFASWLLMGYFRTISRELEDAALVDGATRLQALRSVFIPLALPALAVIALFTFTHAWNEFLFALLLIQRGSQKTVPVGLAEFVVGDVFAWGPLMAGSLLASLPPVLIYVAAQRWVVSGLGGGAIKG